MTNQLAFEAWLTSVKKKQASVLATVLQTESSLTNQESGRMFITDDGQPVGNLGNPTITAQIKDVAKNKLREKNPKSETQTFILPDEQEILIFIDVYTPPVDLIIFGAGHDAIPVANYSVSLGLRTTVVDSRAFYNSEERFPMARRIVTNEESYEENIEIGSRTYIIVMNHHLEKDQESLKFVLNSQAPYVGLLGPRSRRVRMLDALEEDGIIFSSHQLGRLYSPIGLDIGASTPEEIAISILAEIIALRNGHAGGFLQGAEYIHNNA